MTDKVTVCAAADSAATIFATATVPTANTFGTAGASTSADIAATDPVVAITSAVVASYH